MNECTSANNPHPKYNLPIQSDPIRILGRIRSRRSTATRCSSAAISGRRRRAGARCGAPRTPGEALALLDLKNNCIGPEGAEATAMALTSALKSGASVLTHLDLSVNRLTGEEPANHSGIPNRTGTPKMNRRVAPE